MPEVDSKLETIFSHAVALDQAGRFRNTIFVQDKEIFILNMDNTVLLRFGLPKSSAEFEEPISFRANDYDSSNFYEEDGRIVFVQKGSEMIRKKSCGTAAITNGEVQNMFSEFPPLTENKVTLHKNTLSLLEEKLSHIELSAEDGNFKIVQRNIYDGTVIELERSKAKGFGINTKDKINEDFGPIGMKTNDFMALFSFNDTVIFGFEEGEDYCRVQGRNFNMNGVVALCVYDELGGITKTKRYDSTKPNKSNKPRSEENGRTRRKKQKAGRSEQKPDRPNQKRKRRRK